MLMSGKKLRIMVVDEQAERFELLRSALHLYGHEVVARVDATEDIITAVQRTQPDVIIVALEVPGRDTLESMQAISRERPRPIVMFTNDGDSDTIARAVKAGVSAYVVDGMSPERIRPILDVAMHRFQEYQQLRIELQHTRMKLTERKFVEKAKGILMKKRGLDEEEAYRSLRRMAMDRNLRLSELARSIIAAAESLD